MWIVRGREVCLGAMTWTVTYSVCFFRPSSPPIPPVLKDLFPVASTMSETLPPTPPAAVAKGLTQQQKQTIVVLIVAYAVAAGLANAMYFSDGEANNRRLEGLGRLYNWGWLCLSVLTMFLAVKMNYKLAAMARKDSNCKVKLPDQFAFVTASGERVTLAIDGGDGEFNRAQRGILNWMEGPVVVSLAELAIIAVSIGAPAFICALMIGAARFAMTFGYKQAVEKRLPGFVLTQVAEATVHFLMIILMAKAGFKSGLDMKGG